MGFCSHKFNCMFVQRQLGVFPNLFMPVVLVFVTESHNFIKYYINQWNVSITRKLFLWNAVKRHDKCKFLKMNVGETIVKHKKQRNRVHLLLYSGYFASFLKFLLQCKKTKIGTHSWCFVGEFKKDPFICAHTEGLGSTPKDWGWVYTSMF